MDTMSNLGISKAASFRSMRRSSLQPPSSHHPSEGRKSVAHTASSRAALLQALNNNNNNTDFDRASETSSMEERRYAELLGPDRDFDSFPEFGEVHEPRNVGHRLYICGVAQQKAKEDRLRARRERIILRELNELTTKPSITNHARLKPSKGSMFADHSEEWQQRREERLMMTAEKVRAEREKELTASPSINRRSAEIAESSGYRGPVSGWEDHFAKYYAKKSCASLQVPSPGMFTPNVNHSYRNRSGVLDASASSSAADVSSRLYGDAAAREENLQALKEKAEEEAVKDPYTNRPYFTPSRVDYPLHRPEATPEESGSRLHALHQEREQRRVERIAQLDKAVEESKFKPALNPRSVEIGDHRRRPLYEKKDLTATLATGNNNNSRANMSGSSALDESQKSGANTSQKISAAKVEDFLRRTERNNAMRQQRLERIRSEAHDRQTGECTFKPAVNRKSMELFYEINQYGADLSEHTSNRTRHQHQRASAAPVHNQSADGYGGRTGSHGPSTPRAGGGGSVAGSRTAGSPRGNGGHSPSASPISTGRYGVGGNGSNAYGNSSSTGGGAYHRDPMAALDHSHGSNANEYAKQFEAQMFQVLDEWRRLEEV